MQKVNIIIGRFQPFTLGHYKCVEMAFQTRGIPTVIAMIDTPETKVDGRHPFPSTMLLPMYLGMFENDDKVVDVILVKNADIVKIGEECGKLGYEIASWTCGTDRYPAYKAMAERYGEKAGLSEDFWMIEVLRSDEDISATKVRKALVDDDRKTYTRLTPRITFKQRLGGDPYDILRAQILKVMK